MRFSHLTLCTGALAVVLAFTLVSGCPGPAKATPSVFAHFDIVVQVYDPVSKSFMPNVPVYLVSYRAGTGTGAGNEQPQHLNKVTDQAGAAYFEVDYDVDKENAVVFIGASTNQTNLEADFNQRQPNAGPPVPGKIGVWRLFNYNMVTMGYVEPMPKEVVVDRTLIVDPNTGKVTNN